LSNLIKIRLQVEKLKNIASDIKAKKFNNTVQEILAKMQAFSITVKDLQSVKPAKGGGAWRGNKIPSATKAEKRAKKAGAAVAPKYRGPNGEAWSGRGLTPKWLSSLIAQGQPKATFAINAQ
jgi:DNA-binding protein H-NS